MGYVAGARARVLPPLVVGLVAGLALNLTAPWRASVLVATLATLTAVLLPGRTHRR